VRGGGPDQNLTVMDGVEIHDPYRLFGLTSAFNPETIENFEFVAGGFSPKYGDRLSSILLVENRAGTRAKPFAGSFSLALTDANFVVEGALPGGGKGSWIVSGRRTYYDLIANRIVGTTLPSFSDVQAKVTYDVARITACRCSSWAAASAPTPSSTRSRARPRSASVTRRRTTWCP